MARFARVAAGLGLMVLAGMARGQSNVAINDPSASTGGTTVTGVLGGNIVGYYENSSFAEVGFICNGSFTTISNSKFSTINDPSADLSLGTQVAGGRGTNASQCHHGDGRTDWGILPEFRRSL